MSRLLRTFQPVVVLALLACRSRHAVDPSEDVALPDVGLLVRGTVVDADSARPIGGASIRIPGGGTFGFAGTSVPDSSARTSADGRFELLDPTIHSAADSPPDILIVTADGYSTDAFELNGVDRWRHGVRNVTFRIVPNPGADVVCTDRPNGEFRSIDDSISLAWWSATPLDGLGELSPRHRIVAIDGRSTSGLGEVGVAALLERHVGHETALQLTGNGPARVERFVPRHCAFRMVAQTSR